VSQHEEKKNISPSTPGTDSNAANVSQGPAADSKANGSGPVDNPKATNNSEGSNPQPSNAAPVDPFDPMNLGISTDYAAAINAQSSNKPFELRKPNDQEFFRTSPLKHQRLVVGGIVDKTDMGRVYIVSPAILDQVKARFPKAIRVFEWVLAQNLSGDAFPWPVPLAEDRGGQWNSSHRSACDSGLHKWTNMSAGRGRYDITAVDNPKEVDWNSYPPMSEILRQALSDGRLIDSMDHHLLRKLAGKTE
jgi:hypothetical protein